MRSRLSRTVLFETVKLFCFYGGAYLLLICIAVAAPLVREGAPLLDVLLFLPNQLAFPASLALPLAMVTATLSCLARMREDGELTALMATGISPLTVARATLPLALVMMVLSGWMAHRVLPLTHLNFARAKSSLLRQAMATKVARQEPIFQKTDEHNLSTTILTAQTANGDQLGHVFGWQSTATGEINIGYAPAAIWHSEEEIQLSSAPSPDQQARATTGLPPGTTAPNIEDITNQIITRIEQSPQGITLDARMREAIRGGLQRYLDNATKPEDERTITRLNLCLQDGRMLSHTTQAPPLPPQLVLLQATGNYHRDVPDYDIPHPIIAASFQRWIIELETVKGRSNPPEVKTTAELVEEINTLTTILEVFGLEAIPENYRESLGRDARRRLIEHQYVYHLRWVMTVAVLFYWLLACGLALVVPARNRLVAVFVGLVAVIGTLMPSIAIIKGVAEHLPVGPALILWSPPVTMGVLGAFLLWWKR